MLDQSRSIGFGGLIKLDIILFIKLFDHIYYFSPNPYDIPLQGITIACESS
jgi:hypothetical protein